jgi:hypothetical protein
MLKSLKWEEGRVLSIQVAADLYTLAQMRANYLLEVFDTFRATDEWEGVDLNTAKIIFCIVVSPKNIKSIFSERPVEDSVVKNSRPIRSRMLSSILGAPGQMGAKLIELTESYSNIGAKVINPSLSAEDDAELIYEYELCGMEGNPDRLLKRIRVYHQTGVNWDETKKVLFPTLQPPPPSN